jgi:hypothetical protein
MNRLFLQLKWWQWIVVVLWAFSSLLRSSLTAPAEIVGGVIGALVGAYVVVLIVAKVWRSFRNNDNSSADVEADPAN